MADTITTVTLVHERGQVPESVDQRLLRASTDVSGGLHAIVRELEEMSGGVRGGKVTVAVESATAAAATLTLTADVSDCTAGDTLTIGIPGLAPVVITVVDGSAVAASGQVDLNDASDTAFGASIAEVFRVHPVLKHYFTAAAATGTVTVTARRAGSWANSVTAVEAASSNSPFAPGAAAFAGGADHGDAPTATITCGTPDIVADDTITIGSTTLTWKASASGEDQVTLSTTPATAATNLQAKIAAHSTLQGVLSASVADAVVTLTWLGSPRTGQLVALSRAETNSGSVVLSAAKLTSEATHAYQAAPVTYLRGQV